MSISKIRNFNRYFQEIILVFVLLSLSLIPWIEFINTNLNELDFIFNDNLIILLIIYFFFYIFNLFNIKFLNLPSKILINYICCNFSMDFFSTQLFKK